jgi:hypothetical protein
LRGQVVWLVWLAGLVMWCHCMHPPTHTMHPAMNTHHPLSPKSNTHTSTQVLRVVLRPQRVMWAGDFSMY